MFSPETRSVQHGDMEVDLLFIYLFWREGEQGLRLGYVAGTALGSGLPIRA